MTAMREYFPQYDGLQKSHITVSKMNVYVHPVGTAISNPLIYTSMCPSVG